MGLGIERQIGIVREISTQRICLLPRLPDLFSLMGGSVVEDNHDLDHDLDLDDTPLASASSKSHQQFHSFDFEDTSVLDLRRSSIFNITRMSRSIYFVLIKAKINLLLPFGPFAILLHYVTGHHVSLSLSLSLSFLSSYLISLSLSLSSFLRDGSSSSPYWGLLLRQNVSVMLPSKSFTPSPIYSLLLLTPPPPPIPFSFFHPGSLPSTQDPQVSLFYFPFSLKARILFSTHSCCFLQLGVCLMPPLAMQLK